ncbi:MAG: energy transducer TonB [Paludibacteraceae bacterium]|jgi:protein TonB|nr:energy transducer TonB [Paludibacteraceae bacterium]
MEAKKSYAADLENRRISFTLIGFVVVLGFCYIFLEWANADKVIYQDTFSDIAIDDEEMIAQTQQNTPPPPPPEPITPPEIPPAIEVTKEEVTSSTADFSSETSTQEVIAPPPPPAPVQKPVEVAEEPIFVAVEKSASFPGGIDKLYKFLSKELDYPAAAKEAGIQGRVICQFVVNKDGSIVDIAVLKGIDPDLDREAVAVIKRMPKWIPAEQSGKKVRMRYTLPVVFKLN